MRSLAFGLLAAAALAVPAAAQMAGSTTETRRVDTPMGTVQSRTTTHTNDMGDNVTRRTEVRDNSGGMSHHVVRRCTTKWRHGHRVRTCTTREHHNY